MKLTCSKCLTDNPIFAVRSEHGETYQFCHLCDAALMQDERTGNIKYGFMRDDFGDFPISEEDRNMINARIVRAKGESPWKTTASTAQQNSALDQKS